MVRKTFYQRAGRRSQSDLKRSRQHLLPFCTPHVLFQQETYAHQYPSTLTGLRVLFCAVVAIAGVSSYDCHQRNRLDVYNPRELIFLRACKFHLFFVCSSIFADLPGTSVLVLFPVSILSHSFLSFPCASRSRMSLFI